MQTILRKEQREVAKISIWRNLAHFIHDCLQDIADKLVEDRASKQLISLRCEDWSRYNKVLVLCPCRIKTRRIDLRDRR